MEGVLCPQAVYPHSFVVCAHPIYHSGFASTICFAWYNLLPHTSRRAKDMKVLAVGEGGVAVAMGELHLWSYEIVAAEAEVGHDGGMSR